MGSLVTKRGALGQWGSKLYVSTGPAEDVCKETWGVPAELADISFIGDGQALKVERAPLQLDALKAQGVDPSKVQPISVSGWRATQSAASGAPKRGGLPVLWTPQIKALWAPFVPLPTDSAADSLELHLLRLSASSLRLNLCGQPASDELGIPLGIGLSVDGVRIEIGPARDEGL